MTERVFRAGRVEGGMVVIVDETGTASESDSEAEA